MELTSEETREYFRRKWRKPRKRKIQNFRLKKKIKENEIEQVIHIEEGEINQEIIYK